MQYPIRMSHAHAATTIIEVVNAEDLDLIYEFDATEYHVVEGRTLLIRPSQINKPVPVRPDGSKLLLAAAQLLQ